jgi:seryl-tRNA synthetase
MLVEKLGLHYQTSLLATRDASASMRLTYDIEVWLPSIGIYKEVSSASWAGDYQARRANIRYRPQQGKGTAFIHTLNASGLATSRLLPAIVEQNQQPDGSVVVPEPLRPWLGTDVLRLRHRTQTPPNPNPTEPKPHRTQTPPNPNPTEPKPHRTQTPPNPNATCRPRRRHQ